MVYAILGYKQHGGFERGDSVRACVRQGQCVVARCWSQGGPATMLYIIIGMLLLIVLWPLLLPLIFVWAFIEYLLTKDN